MFRQLEHCPACKGGYKKRRGLTCPHCRVQLVHRGEAWDVSKPAWLRSKDHKRAYDSGASRWVFKPPEQTGEQE
jgi:hypothetical protein